MRLIGLDGLFVGGDQREPRIEDFEEDPLEYAEKTVRLYMRRDLKTAWTIRLKMRAGNELQERETIALDLLVRQYNRNPEDVVGKRNFLRMPVELKSELYTVYDTLRALLFGKLN